MTSIFLGRRPSVGALNYVRAYVSPLEEEPRERRSAPDESSAISLPQTGPRCSPRRGPLFASDGNPQCRRRQLRCVYASPLEEEPRERRSASDEPPAIS